MSRLLERLAPGSPPLRMHELADLTGFSTEYFRKLREAGSLVVVVAPGGTERRVPVQEAERIARDLRLID